MNEWDVSLCLPECFQRKTPNLPPSTANFGGLSLEGRNVMEVLESNM